MTDTGKVTNDESLKNLINNAVIIKLKSGRVLSGFLREQGNSLTVKLGVLHIPIESSQISRISKQETLVQL